MCWYAQVGLLAAFGGGLITAIILNVPIPLFSSNTLGITWTVCWWLANYSPGSVVAKVLTLVPVRIPAKVRYKACQSRAVQGHAIADTDPYLFLALRDSHLRSCNPQMMCLTRSSLSGCSEA